MDAANAAFIDYNMVLEPITRDANGKRVGGRYGTFDRFQLVSGNVLYVGPYIACRAEDTKPFGSPQPIAGLTGLQEFADPVVGHVGGKLKLFYAAIHNNAQNQPVRGIYMDDLRNPTTAPKVAGKPQLIVGDHFRAWCRAWRAAPCEMPSRSATSRWESPWSRLSRMTSWSRSLSRSKATSGISICSRATAWRLGVAMCAYWVTR